jgi:hypothetical protein
MEQVRIVRKGRKPNDRWLPEHREVLRLTPRDPDIARAKELNKNEHVNGDPGRVVAPRSAPTGRQSENGYESRRDDDLLFPIQASVMAAKAQMRPRASNSSSSSSSSAAATFCSR